jgi:hypothetical protein
MALTTTTTTNNNGAEQLEEAKDGAGVPEEEVRHVIKTKIKIAPDHQPLP